MRQGDTIDTAMAKLGQAELWLVGQVSGTFKEAKQMVC